MVAGGLDALEVEDAHEGVEEKGPTRLVEVIVEHHQQETTSAIIVGSMATGRVHALMVIGVTSATDAEDTGTYGEIAWGRFIGASLN